MKDDPRSKLIAIINKRLQKMLQEAKAIVPRGWGRGIYAPRSNDFAKVNKT